MANTAGQVRIPSQTTSTEITPGVVLSQVWLTPAVSSTGSVVYVGPSGVTPETGFPLKPGERIGPLTGASAIHGVVGEGKDPVEVCFLQLA